MTIEAIHNATDRFEQYVSFGSQEASFAVVNNLVQDQIKTRGITTIGIEGSPIYAFPNPLRRSQHWDSDAFKSGWEITDRLFSELSSLDIDLHHWLLVDDYNTAEGVSARRGVFAPTIRSIRETLQFPTILQTIDRGHIFLESHFVNPNRTFNRCSNLDADFQLQKFRNSAQAGTLQNNLQILVHPEDFRQQQSLMFVNLLGAMKKDHIFQSLSKDERRNLIEKTYLHVWITQDGSVNSVTKPYWDGQKFELEEMEEL